MSKYDEIRAILSELGYDSCQDPDDLVPLFSDLLAATGEDGLEGERLKRLVTSLYKAELVKSRQKFSKKWYDYVQSVKKTSPMSVRDMRVRDSANDRRSAFWAMKYILDRDLLIELRQKTKQKIETNGDAS
ncbi:hypothetical protein N825_16250 [Skermanella stibiiresistens SB22]|uniref:Uncharacterized protein n=1 Tax=Skermanella stibiiresistens SB22 TaxID=1385369 RepID=W9GVW6_9PROT|nr:hypothetical protein [Skermanella stibiiresistens]EWY37954.1 hypothetical protein N825_16250 [Skermanella stibiiresistens SB22]